LGAISLADCDLLAPSRCDLAPQLEPSRRPDAQAFEALLVKMDTDQDGQISVGEIRKLIKDMREIADVTDEENTGVTPGAKAAAAAAAAGGSGP
jgi:hypothetical protein